MTNLKQTKLHEFHVENGAKMIPFAGYSMPIQYPLGILKEHLHTRAKAGLFDVSHMGQAFLIPKDGNFETAAGFLETLVPADIKSLEPGQQRYTQLLNEEGGILDDLMVTRLGMPEHCHWIYIVVNAGCKDDDYAHIRTHLSEGITLRISNQLSLLALQGPSASKIMSGFLPEAVTMPFMNSLDTLLKVNGDNLLCHISRSGYTGEDGFEISIKHDQVLKLAKALLVHDDVELIGLGARDSLRLEAGLCLYGHDIDTSTSPIEAGLVWSIRKNRRKTGGFLGAGRIQRELVEKPARCRVGIKPLARAPAREGTEVLSQSGDQIGVITSGSFGPSVGSPVAMGYVQQKFSKIGTKIDLRVRGKAMPAKIIKLPFIPNNFYRGE